MARRRMCINGNSGYTGCKRPAMENLECDIDVSGRLVDVIRRLLLNRLLYPRSTLLNLSWSVLLALNELVTEPVTNSLQTYEIEMF